MALFSAASPAERLRSVGSLAIRESVVYVYIYIACLTAIHVQKALKWLLSLFKIKIQLEREACSNDTNNRLMNKHALLTSFFCVL